VRIASWPGLIAIILAIISFYGTTYLVIALNVGWRFGYWLSSACFGALMVLLSIFWVINVTPEQAVGPQGATPSWHPIAAGTEVESAEFNGEPVTAVSSYPGGSWTTPEEGDTRVDLFNSTVTSCVTATDEALEDMEEPAKTACEEARSLMPAPEEIPVLEGSAVAVQATTFELRFSEDGGFFGAAEIHPLTTDPRVTEDPDGETLAEPFVLVMALDKGSIGVPTYMSLVIFLIYEAFHLWGLHRAERRQLSPAVI
jgi:hypothetical protein